MHSNLFHNGCTVILLSFASKCGHSRSDFTFTVRKPKRTQCRIRVKNLPTLWLILELAEFFCTIALLDCHACVQGKRWRVGPVCSVWMEAHNAVCVGLKGETLYSIELSMKMNSNSPYTALLLPHRFFFDSTFNSSLPSPQLMFSSAEFVIPMTGDPSPATGHNIDTILRVFVLKYRCIPYTIATTLVICD